MENLVQQTANTRFIKVREDLIKITGDSVSAIILDSFISWTLTKYKMEKNNGVKDEDVDYSFTRTYYQIMTDCFDLFGKNTLSIKLKKLEELGYIERIIRDSDFKTNRYLVNNKKINDDLIKEFGTLNNESKKEDKKPVEKKEKVEDVCELNESEKALCDKFVEITGITYKDDDEKWNNPLKFYAEQNRSVKDIEDAITLFHAARNAKGQAYILSSPKSLINFVNAVDSKRIKNTSSHTLDITGE